MESDSVAIADFVEHKLPVDALVGSGRDRRRPVLGWLFGYRREDLVGDVMAGAIVAIMLVPQSMAYALLAGLPPEVGLYASIVPLILYGVLGTSHALAVGPVAIVSLLVASSVGALAEPGTALYLQLALTLALLAGLLQVLMGMLRLGFLVNFLSQPVLSGFTSAAAIVIGFSQLKHLLGLTVPRAGRFYELLLYLLQHVTESHLTTLGIGLGGISILIYFRIRLGRRLHHWGLPEGLIVPLTKAAPLVVVIVGTLLVWVLRLDAEAGVKIVGQVPGGLPPLTVPSLDADVWQALLPAALIISFVGYMQSIAMAKALASKRRHKVGVNQELVALGAANLGAALTGGYPVTGGFSRSAVNLGAGANTPLASIITAGLMGGVAILMTPLFYFLPQAALAAIILVAVLGLVDLATLKHLWRYDKADAASLVITFLAVLIVGVESGILVGVASAVALFFWRTSRPHVAIVGRLGEGEAYRNVTRHPVTTCPHVLAVRVDESLYFANAQFLQDTLLRLVAEQPAAQHLVLIASAVNHIDASALETLEGLVQELRDARVALYLAAVKGPVLDRLQAVGFVEEIGADHIFLSVDAAFRALGCA